MGVLNVFRGCTFFALRSTFAALPGKPGIPICANKTEDSIQMHWDPPLNDGGKPVKGYIVDIREYGSEKWTQYVSLLNKLSLGNCLTVRIFFFGLFPSIRLSHSEISIDPAVLRERYYVTFALWREPSVCRLSVCLSVCL